MKFSNSIELEIRGERALFRDPLRPQTLPVPSCEALKGILGSIYWNPDFIWVPDSLRVMEPIGYTREGARTSDGSRFTNAGVHCLKDVRYQLRAHFVWNEQRPGDDLARRLSALPGNCDIPAEACRRWFDVRAFGQVFSSRGMHAPGVKGAVSIQPAVSVCPVKVISTGITCCLPNNGKISMGFKSSVEHGLYILRGSIIPGVAAKNGLTCADCELLREALLHFPDNDCSSSRPAGSIEVRRLYWWEHPGKLGVCPPATVFSSVIAEPLRSRPVSFADYEITNAEIPGVKLSIFENDTLTAVGNSRRG